MSMFCILIIHFPQKLFYFYIQYNTLLFLPPIFLKLFFVCKVFLLVSDQFYILVYIHIFKKLLTLHYFIKTISFFYDQKQVDSHVLIIFINLNILMKNNHSLDYHFDNQLLTFTLHNHYNVIPYYFCQKIFDLNYN